MLPASNLAAAERICGHPRFDKALRRLSRDLATLHRFEPQLVYAVGDRGAFAIVAAGIAFETERGVTLAAVQDFVVGAKLASVGRVRGFFSNLARTGAATPLHDRQDGRRRPWSFGGWLLPTLERWLGAYRDALAEMDGVVDGPTLPLYMRRSVAAYQRQGAPLAAAYSGLSLFLDRQLGHLLLLEAVVRAEDTLTDRDIVSTVSRKRFARGLRTSRAHITLLLADAERRGLLQRTQSGSDLWLADTTSRSARMWFAHELAWVMDVCGAPT
ncbi:MAG TPA: hypothetical protein VGC27_00810 [Rhizomicrobium sp.]